MQVKHLPQLVYLATHNRHKITEIREILGDVTSDVRPASDLDPGLEWQETGATFEENAKIKVIALSTRTQACILGEDSGLCVDALGGEPGVYSKRYAALADAGKLHSMAIPDTDVDAANTKMLLAKLAHVPAERRTAYFICAMVYLDEEGKLHSFEGRCAGSITLAPRGNGGFGYDPVFVPAGHTQTLAEMSADIKNAISHRRKALEAWAAFLHAPGSAGKR